jgi:hypothetical protein
MVPPLFDSCAPFPDSAMESDAPGASTPASVSAASFLSTIFQPSRSTGSTVDPPGHAALHR